MALSFNGINQSLTRTASASITGQPITFGSWVYPTTTSTSLFFVNFGTTGTRSGTGLGTWTNSRWALMWGRSDTGGGLFRVTAANNTIVLNQWQYVCGYMLNDSTSAIPQWVDQSGIYASTSDALTVYDENAPILTTTTWTRMGIGARQQNVVDGFFPGRVAETAAWNTILTVSEMRSLAKGVKPTYIRPNNLKFYMPGIREIGQDLAQGLTFTNNNSVSVIEHPRRYG